MTAQRAVIAIVIFIGLFGLWNLLHPTHSYRYRLTVEVEKDGKVHSGSSVVELITTRNFFLSALDTVPEWGTAYRGEAVFVDLGGGDHLVTLLVTTDETGPTASLPSRVILGAETARGKLAGVYDALTTQYPGRLADAEGRSYPVTFDQLPPMIRFRDLDDPLTVERVDPADLAASYGPGVVFRAAKLEITRDTITEAITQRLPWLNQMRPDKSLSGSIGTSWLAGDLPYANPRQIAYRNFLAE